jgi:hypothetical protein
MFSGAASGEAGSQLNDRLVDAQTATSSAAAAVPYKIGFFSRPLPNDADEKRSGKKTPARKSPCG